MVVQEFRAAIEKGGLVFIAFADELFPAAEAVAAVAEVGSHAANQEIGAAPSHMKNPGQHGGGGGFAVGSGNDDRSVPRNKIFLEQLGHGAVRNLFIEDVFDLGIAPGDDVAN